ncbi:High-affinity nickel-transporter [Candidatus Sulfotelmatobacter sp. SbA7]|jgi:high-affinity nickel permease|nr:High-affinity nickel-transporter [Candidatus Sulfotelmatobacter sp. SbA7]
MINLLTVIGVGFLLGIRHATDPDHVIAVTTIVSRQRSIRHAGLIGILWGVGHTITILCVGAAIILFNLVIPPRIGLTMELAVGLMLILLGVLNLAGVTQWVTDRFMPAHSHVHGHNTEVHVHLKDQPEGALQKALARVGLYQLLRPLAVGIVHGLAGSAAVALLVLTTIREPRWAIVYLLVFGVGTIAGMMLITVIIGAPFAYTGKRFVNLNRGLGVASGLISVAFGLLVTFQIGFVDGLFTANPQWTPH